MGGSHYRICMDYQYRNHGKKSKETCKSRENTLENRKSGIQSPKTLAGEYRTCMQFQWESTEESLHYGTDSRFHQAIVWVLFSKEKWDQETAKKYIFRLISQLWKATNKGRYIIKWYA